MKFAIVIPDGCADEPQDELNQRTPLEAARIPHMDEIARLGMVGQSNHVPDGFTPGSEVANLSLLGYDPHRFFTGRAPIEAAARGILLGPHDWAIRCNLVTIADQVLHDFTAGHITSDEAAQLLARLQQHVADSRWEFVPGVSYRNLLIYRGGDAYPPFSAATTTIAPHDLTDEPVLDAFPRGPGSDLLVEWMHLSERVFAADDVNRQRRERGQSEATHVWLWGLGQSPDLPSFQDRHGITGSMITAVDLLRGLARLVGWTCIEVPGATGYLDTNYAAKGTHAVAALREFDLVCVHVEATDEASHEGRADAKIHALEEIDRCIVAPLHAALRDCGEYRILISPDHPTLLRTKMHSRGWVPWCSCGTGISPQGADGYHERAAAGSRVSFPNGWQQMETFLCR